MPSPSPTPRRRLRTFAALVALATLLPAAPAAAQAPDAPGATRAAADAAAEQDLTEAYGRALLLGTVFSSQDLAVAAADTVTESIVPEHEAHEDIAGPPTEDELAAVRDAAPVPPAGASANPGSGADTATSADTPSAAQGEQDQPPHAGILGPAPELDHTFEVRPSVGFEMEADDDTPEGYQPLTGGPITGGYAGGWVCPVPQWTWFTHDWGFPRSGGRTHKGNDIFAPEGSPLLAVASGVVVKAQRTERGLGGLVVSYLTDDGLVIYNAHLHSVSTDLRVGTRVIPGQQIGTVGRSGNARTTPPHLHIGVYPSAGGVLDPYPWTSAACR